MIGMMNAKSGGGGGHSSNTFSTAKRTPNPNALKHQRLQSHNNNENVTTHMFMDMSCNRYTNQDVTGRDVFTNVAKDDAVGFFGKLNLFMKGRGSKESLYNQSPDTNIREEALYHQWTQNDNAPLQRNMEVYEKENIYEMAHNPIYRSNIPKYKNNALKESVARNEQVRANRDEFYIPNLDNHRFLPYAFKVSTLLNFISLLKTASGFFVALIFKNPFAKIQRVPLPSG